MASKSYISPGIFSSIHKFPTSSWDFLQCPRKKSSKSTKIQGIPRKISQDILKILEFPRNFRDHPLKLHKFLGIFVASNRRFHQNPKKYYEFLGKYHRMASKSYNFPGILSSIHKFPVPGFFLQYPRKQIIKIHQNSRNS